MTSPPICIQAHLHVDTNTRTHAHARAKAHTNTHAPECANAHAYNHNNNNNNNMTLHSSLLIESSHGGMLDLGQPVRGQHQRVIKLVKFNVYVALVTDKQLKQLLV